MSDESRTALSAVGSRPTGVALTEEVVVVVVPYNPRWFAIVVVIVVVVRVVTVMIASLWRMRRVGIGVVDGADSVRTTRARSAHGELEVAQVAM